MPRTPLVAVRAALRSAVEAIGEAGHRPSRAIEGHGPAQAAGRSADRHARASEGPRRSSAFTICDVTPVDNWTGTAHQ